jgi:hypothetical protein
MAGIKNRERPKGRPCAAKLPAPKDSPALEARQLHTGTSDHTVKRRSVRGKNPIKPKDRLQAREDSHER